MPTVAFAHGNLREEALKRELLSKEKARLAELADQHRWISLVERQPVLKTKVVALCRTFNIALGQESDAKKVRLVTREKQGWFDESGNYVHVTHWMPLPLVPEERPTPKKAIKKVIPVAFKTANIKDKKSVQ